jgi:hypothetical protein
MRAWIMRGTLTIAMVLAAAPAFGQTADGQYGTASPGTSKEQAQDLWVNPVWARGSSRWFFSTVVDTGFLYLRPRVAFGQGRPHQRWLGVEANPIASRELLGGYAGLRAHLPNFDMRIGARYSWGLANNYVPRVASLDRLTLESTRGNASMVTYESEGNAKIPLGPGSILLLGSISYVAGIPAGSMALEETLRVVVDPPWVLRGRAGYSLPFGKRKQLAVSFVMDAVSVPKRASVVLRAGAIFTFALSESIEVRGTFVPRIVSPDDIGLLDSDFTELGLRFRWATE